MNIDIESFGGETNQAIELNTGDLCYLSQNGNYSLLAVKSWSGLHSLDGQYSWPMDILKHLKVVPLPKGTVIKLTV